jgi:hypothetical protein
MMCKNIYRYLIVRVNKKENLFILQLEQGRSILLLKLRLTEMELFFLSMSLQLDREIWMNILSESDAIKNTYQFNALHPEIRLKIFNGTIASAMVMKVDRNFSSIQSVPTIFVILIRSLFDVIIEMTTSD